MTLFIRVGVVTTHDETCNDNRCHHGINGSGGINGYAKVSTLMRDMEINVYIHTYLHETVQSCVEVINYQPSYPTDTVECSQYLRP